MTDFEKLVLQSLDVLIGQQNMLIALTADLPGISAEMKKASDANFNANLAARHAMTKYIDTSDERDAK